MKNSGELRHLHTYVLISLLACVGSCAIASAVVARDLRSRAGRYAAGLLVGGAVWSLLELMANRQADEALALRYIHAAGATTVLLGAVALQLVVEIFAPGHSSMRRLLGALWVSAAGFALIALTSSVFVSGLEWTAFGWQPILGPLAILPALHAAICMFFSTRLLAASKRDETVPPTERLSRRLIGASVYALLIVMALTEVVLPGLEISVPRLGALSVMLMGGVVWLFSTGLGEYVPPPSAFARRVLNALDDGVALITTDGRIRAVNPALARLCGRAPESLVQSSVSEILGETLDELGSELVDRETLMEQAIGEAIAISLSSSTLFDRDGSLLGSVLVMRDQREVVELRRQLVAAGRLAAVGELAAGIAHEVNNPMAFIQANLHCLQRNEASLVERIEKETPESSQLAFLDEGRHLIGQCMREVSRVSAIVKEIRGFSHMGAGELQWNDVNGLLESSVRIALPRLRRSAKLEIERGDLPQVHCAGQDLKQVFLDLILTAARSMESSGSIRIRTALEGDRVTVRIEDDGQGISEKDLERVYHPARLREPRAEGTPDYSVAYQIVLQHGGEMEVESPSEGGTRVCIRLPISERSVADDGCESQEGEETREGEPASDPGATAS